LDFDDTIYDPDGFYARPAGSFIKEAPKTYDRLLYFSNFIYSQPLWADSPQRQCSKRGCTDKQNQQYYWNTNKPIPVYHA